MEVHVFELNVIVLNKKKSKWNKVKPNGFFHSKLFRIAALVENLDKNALWKFKFYCRIGCGA